MFNVTIDGKAGCGKSTLAEELSKRLDLKKFNTGAVYRGITCEYLNKYGEKLPNEEVIEEFLNNLELSVVFDDNNEQHIIVNGKDYTSRLREEIISNFVANIAPFDNLREKVREIQRTFAKNYNCIMEGRDIGTVVLPFAQCKLFITASNRVRAERRYEQLKGTENCPTVDELVAELDERDFKDINREHGALLPAEDSIIIDNSNETLEQTITRCVNIIQDIKNKSNLK